MKEYKCKCAFTDMNGEPFVFKICDLHFNLAVNENTTLKAEVERLEFELKDMNSKFKNLHDIKSIFERENDKHKIQLQKATEGLEEAMELYRNAGEIIEVVDKAEQTLKDIKGGSDCKN